MFDITALGELLVDLTQTGTQNGIPQYAACPGGAPANVAVAAAKLGASSAFIGKVGRDAFGALLRDTLVKNGVDTAALFDCAAPTTLAVVSVDGSGERSFSFYRDGGADTLLTEQEACGALTACPKFFHFGSVSLTHPDSRRATLAAARRAREMGALISYDPNYRPALWRDERTAVHQMRHPLPLVDVLKVSEEELPLLTGCADLERGTWELTRTGIPLVLVTLGERGAFCRMDAATALVPGVSVRVADTNGAGDTFLGAVLSRLAKRGEKPLQGLTGSELEDILSFANRAAALTCSRPGAIPAMPTLDELR